jgi:hypothetical protein
MELIGEQYQGSLPIEHEAVRCPDGLMHGMGAIIGSGGGVPVPSEEAPRGRVEPGPQA